MAAELPALSASAVDYGDAWGAYSGHPPPAAAALAVPGAKRARERASVRIRALLERDGGRSQVNDRTDVCGPSRAPAWAV